MEITRRQILTAGITTLSAGMCLGQVVKSAYAAKSISTLDANKSAEAMLLNWLELFGDKQGEMFEDYSLEEIATPIFGNSNYLSGIHVTLHSLKKISKPTCFVGSRLKSLTCPNLTSIIGQQQFMSSQKLEFVDFPKLEDISNGQAMFGSCSGALTDINLGNVESIGNPDSFLTGCSKLQHVYLRKMHCSTLLGYSSLFKNAPHQVILYCADGNVVWNDTDGQWEAVDAL